MNIVTAEEMTACEEAAFRSGIDAGALMDAAGEAMAGAIIENYPAAREFLVLAGKGNNGGDGLVVAQHLAASGRSVRVVLALAAEHLGQLPRARLARLREVAPQVVISPWRADLPFPDSDGVVIDALLGLQASGPLRGPLAEIVSGLNTARAARFFRTVALDLPTGLAAFVGPEAPPPERDAAVIADLTLAVGFIKNALVREENVRWVGRIDVIPWTTGTEEGTAPRQALVPHELAALLPRRGALSYKGSFGHLVIVAGSSGFAGAPVLCVQAAQAIGAGLLSVVTRPDVLDLVAGHAPPEAMVSAWTDLTKTPPVVEKASAIIFGPGLGADSATQEMLRAVLRVGCPVLIDADGLNVLARNLKLLGEARGPVLLTPHAGEMHRLIDRTFTPGERERVARQFTEWHAVTLLLKGTRTLITARDEPFYFNTTGNPGLSTGGSGDTLAGIVGGLLAQGLEPLDALRLGAWLHGHAADLALRQRGGEEGMTPTQVSAHLGEALLSLRRKASERGLLTSR